MARRPKRRKTRRRTSTYVLAAVGLLVLAAAGFYIFSGGTHGSATKPIILYVNQGNGIVNSSNFGDMLSFAATHGFNTIFFQVYRQGTLLFPVSGLSAFVNESHAGGLKIFFALYITNSSQRLPTSIYGLGEDGISLDMSTLSPSAQQETLSNLTASYRGQSAVTTTDMESTLRPNLLVLETYGSSLKQYIRHGTIASVEVVATTSEQDYKSQLQYALQNSDGVMVFDYAGLMKRGY